MESKPTVPTPELSSKRSDLWESLADRVNNRMAPLIGLIESRAEDGKTEVADHAREQRDLLTPELATLRAEAAHPDDIAAINELLATLEAADLTTITGVESVSNLVNSKDPRRRSKI